MLKRFLHTLLPLLAAMSAAQDVVFAPVRGEDAADALQALIDASPNRTIYIPDGEYVLSHPVATPADLRLPSRLLALSGKQ